MANNIVSFNTVIDKFGDAFSPAQLNLEAWYDASDENTIVEAAGAVSQWDDKSGNGNNVTQGTAKNQPETGTGTINGLNAIDWDAVGFEHDQMLLDTPITGQGVIYAFMVCDFDNLSSGNGVLHKQGATTDFLGGGSSGNIQVRFAGQQFSGGTGIGTNPGMMGMWIDSSLDVYVSGNGETPVNVGTFVTGTDWNFGRFGRNGSDTLDGLVGEVIILTTEPTVAERQKIEGYLAWKWGLVADLPGGHPYKNEAP